MTSPGSSPETADLAYPTQILVDGDVTQGDVDYGWRRLLPVVEKVDEPVHLVRMKLSLAEPNRERRAGAQVLVDVRGDLVRAQVAADTMPEAIDLLKDRLRSRLDHRSERRKARRNRATESPAGEWRRGDFSADRPVRYDRPREERELVARKSYALDEITPDEAIFDMEQLDHDFYLFRDLTSGGDAVVARQENGNYLLARTQNQQADLGPSAFEIQISEGAPPRLSVDDAIRDMETLDVPYVLFIDDDSGRGEVVYHRYDGHYGLISPGDED